ncbi:zinc finger protein Xfin-like [Actinia tenebrosa]|uniref:Zinc finger protein Xfin-like n=1 Tax=Actinia tenebrosa TaxID=6105 RepID=A0A6P8HDL9_ACTTE|nr:zinc finger protein Xfin-like [Actinia tenebrosa]
MDQFTNLQDFEQYYLNEIPTQCKKTLHLNNFNILSLKTHFLFLQNRSTTQSGGGQQTDQTSSYQCSKCQKTFTNKKTFKRHQREHDKEKSHKCPHCLKGFKRNSDLSKHLKTVHSKHNTKKEFKCGKCNKTFSEKNTFNAHVKEHSNQKKKRKLTSDDSTGPQRKKTRTASEPNRPRTFPVAEDPVKISDLLPDQQPTNTEYHRHWKRIRTRLANWYNYRLPSLNPDHLISYFHQVFRDQSTVFKLNISFGYILRNTVTDEVQYHYASRNNNNVFETPFQVVNESDLQPIENELRNLDILEWARQ